MPAKILIRNDGYKKFQNITVHTQVGFQIHPNFENQNLIVTIYILIIDQSIYSIQKVLFIKRIKRRRKKIYFGMNSHELLLLSPCIIRYSLLLIEYGK